MTFNVKPNPDKKVNGKPLQVRDPITGQHLPKSGKHVPRNAYWLRRLRDKDVVEVKATDATGDAVDEKLSLDDAILKCLEANDDTHLGKDGKPDCNVLTELTGTSVTKKQRDAAMTSTEGK